MTPARYSQPKLADLDRNPPPGTVSISFADPDLATPYTQQADIGIEQQLGRNMSVTVSYLWSRGSRMLTRQDLNIGPASGTVTYRINDAAREPGRHLYHRYLPGGQSRRQSLQPRAVGRQRWKGLVRRPGGAVPAPWREVGGGLHCLYLVLCARPEHGHGWIQHLPDGRASDAGQRRLLGEKGNSALDQRHRFVLAAIVNPPSKDFGSTFANQALNGWQLSLISTLASSDFATPTVLVSGAQFPGAAFTTTLNGFGGSSRVPFLPQSSIPVDTTTGPTRGSRSSSASPIATVWI